MLNSFKKLFKRKPRIIPFYTLNDDENELLEKYRELTPKNKCKILSFAYRKKYVIGEHAESGQEPPKTAPGPYKLFFIWNYL